MSGSNRVKVWGSLVGGVFATILVIFGAGMMGGSAEVRANSSESGEAQGTGNLLPLEDVMDKAKELHEGQVIEAELKSINGKEMYEIEILDEGGKVWEMNFDAVTGELINHVQGDKSESPGR